MITFRMAEAGAVGALFFLPTCTNASTYFCHVNMQCIALNQDCSKQEPFDSVSCPDQYLPCWDKEHECCSTNQSLPNVPIDRNYFPGEFPTPKVSLLSVKYFKATQLGKQMIYFDNLEEFPKGTVWAVWFRLAADYGKPALRKFGVTSHSVVTDFSNNFTNSEISVCSILCSVFKLFLNYFHSIRIKVFDGVPVARLITIPSTNFSLTMKASDSCGSVKINASIIDNFRTEPINIATSILIKARCEGVTFFFDDPVEPQTVEEFRLFRSSNCDCQYEMQWSDENEPKSFIWDGPSSMPYKFTRIFNDVGKYFVEIYAWNSEGNYTVTVFVSLRSYFLVYSNSFYFV